MLNEKKAQLYFKNSDSEFCYSLQKHLAEAKYEGLKQITLVKAAPEKTVSDHIFCTYHNLIADRGECKKIYCNNYTANKSGRGTCIYRGKLYSHGDAEEFEVS